MTKPISFIEKMENEMKRGNFDNLSKYANIVDADDDYTSPPEIIKLIKLHLCGKDLRDAIAIGDPPKTAELLARRHVITFEEYLEANYGKDL